MNFLKSFFTFSWDIIKVAAIALVLAGLVRYFLVQPFFVEGASMEPNFEDGEYLLIDEISYYFKSPQRGEVIVFHYPLDASKYYIKRVIGLPNETVDIKGNEVTITNGDYKEGFKLEQPFVKNISNNDTHFELKNDEYFVMGDNRSASSDSRYWGAVKKDLLTGKALLRLLPVNKVDFWPGSYIQENK